jgi:hypothetical protein
MPAKTIQQQPVAIAHVQSVTYVIHYPTGAIDLSAVYRPVDETGTPVGAARTYSDSKTGAATQEIVTWITNEVLPEINAAEGT